MPISDPEKRRKYHREWIANRRASFFADKQCIRCGATMNLELDHLDPLAKTEHRIWSWSEERRNAEIAKCQILCHDCHQRKTIENNDNLKWRGDDRTPLTEQNVRDIRKRYAEGTTSQRKLAIEYGVDRARLRNITNRTTWKHIE